MDKNESKLEIEKLLQENEYIEICPEGWSMYPFLIPGKSIVRLVRFDQADSYIKRGDVLLFRSKNTGRLVLHRVHHISKDMLFMVGDNQTTIEENVSNDAVLAVMSDFLPNTKKRNSWISVKNVRYIFTSRIWLLLFPVRKYIIGLVHGVKTGAGKQ